MNLIQANSITNTDTGNHLPQLDKIRVLVLFGGSELFGHERATIEVFRNLSQLGLKVKFLISSRVTQDNIPLLLDEMGLSWVKVPYGYKWYYWHCIFTNLWGVLITNILLRREIQKWQPTHIYTGNWLNLTYTAPTILSSQLAFVYRAGDDIPSSRLIHRWFNSLVFPKVTTLVCNCQFLARKLTQKLPFFDPIVIYNYPPFRLEKSTSESQLPKIPHNSAVVLYVGQISEHKGVKLLIKTMLQLLLNGHNSVLWLAGNARWNPEFTIQLQKEIAQAKLEERICLLGYVDNTQKLFARADIHVCPSIWDDPSPNVILEAKQAGVPSVVFPVGGIPELVEHQVDGYICPESTVEALTEGIGYFLEQSEKRHQASEACEEIFRQRFSQERFQSQWASVFGQSVLEAHSNSKNV